MSNPAKTLAATYYRVFNSEDGRVVLADLLGKFSPRRSRFQRGKQPDATLAAIIDGEANVLLEIEDAIAAGKYSPDP